MKKYFFTFVIFAILALPLTGFAATFAGGETVDLANGSTLDDNFYAGGAAVTLSDEITGDIYVAGSIVSINASVGGDVIAVGSVVGLYSDVLGDVRAGGSMVNIGGNIVGETILGGSLIHILPGAVIHGNLYAWGASVIIDGTVKGSVETSGAAVAINGIVEGDVVAHAEEMKVGGSAQINGMLTYTSPEEGEISEAAMIGSLVYEKTEAKKGIMGDKGGFENMMRTLFFGIFTIKFFGLLLVALILTFACKKCTTHYSKEIFENFWSSLGIGVVAVIIFPIVILLLCLTLIGFYAAAILGCVFAFACLLAGALAPVIFGSLLHKLMTKSKSYSTTWWSTLLGLFLMAIVLFIPIIGWFLVWLFILAVFGSLLKKGYQHIGKKPCCQ
ncbi:MAG: hypothetical protein UU08_C0003G0049 [Candidatus Uhrbacteria bacterium GW2011_GWE2_40_58]|nr:MAG: hypothetical protein UT94_C0043G0006 [Candidatus Uhrbacteria bacterium GW2011_GWF2_40_263]KKR68126.1 MAG: hypothetical protein UU08_C0003G0049 [Candidatus Uhrbacteria bacterium GW2011_GWE2_40_58]OGL96620.1 MAG: hypothetical protein A2332_03265 [Candidatus Uhrbacteria bacterium RIFOXYB2_FULL_41_18]HBK34416.1 hypothetical protein [Candidatus Uhrbacteria bacterium]HCB55755.1 hypothetical protein [Candidatus Uhrbacteria bacterium]